MSVLIGTFLALLLCALVFGLRIMLGAGPVEAGCGRAAVERCAGCPNKGRPGACARSARGGR